MAQHWSSTRLKFEAVTMAMFLTSMGLLWLTHWPAMMYAGAGVSVLLIGESIVIGTQKLVVGIRKCTS